MPTKVSNNNSVSLTLYSNTIAITVKLKVKSAVKRRLSPPLDTSRMNTKTKHPINQYKKGSGLNLASGLYKTAIIANSKHNEKYKYQNLELTGANQNTGSNTMKNNKLNLVFFANNSYPQNSSNPLTSRLHNPDISNSNVIIYALSWLLDNGSIEFHCLSVRKLIVVP
jgi:hypothetical protein